MRMRSFGCLAFVLGFGIGLAQKGALDTGDPTLPSGEFRDVFTFTAPAPGPLDVVLASSDFDVYLIVVDAAGAVLAEVDDTDNEGTNVRTTVALPAAGEFRIVVTSAFPDERGSYALLLTFAGAPVKAAPAAATAVAAPASPVAPPDATPPATPAPARRTPARATPAAAAPAAAPATPAAPAAAATPASPPAATPPATPPAPATTPTPGLATGRVTDGNGAPIAVPGAVVTVAITGVVLPGGQTVSVTTRPDATGAFTQRLPDGTFALRAVIEVPFEGERYRFDLESVGGDAGMRDAAGGIAQDFVWRTRGLRPDAAPGSTDPFDYFGESIVLSFQTYRNDVGRSVMQGPADARLLFTLTPVGPLVDGSAGEERTFELRYDPLLGGVTPNRLLDVPLGRYLLRGVQIDAQGAVTPLLMQQSFAVFGDAVEVAFSATFTGANPPIVGFTLP